MMRELLFAVLVLGAATGGLLQSAAYFYHKYLYLLGLKSVSHTANSTTYTTITHTALLATDIGRWTLTYEHS